MPGMNWQVLRLAMGSEQTPDETQRETFDQVIMRPTRGRTAPHKPLDKRGTIV